MLIRGESLAASMSSYLIDRIDRIANITLHRRIEITRLSGSGHLDKVDWTNKQTGQVSEHAIRQCSG